MRKLRHWYVKWCKRLWLQNQTLYEVLSCGGVLGSPSVPEKEMSSWRPAGRVDQTLVTGSRQKFRILGPGCVSSPCDVIPLCGNLRSLSIRPLGASFYMVPVWFSLQLVQVCGGWELERGEEKGPSLTKVFSNRIRACPPGFQAEVTDNSPAGRSLELARKPYLLIVYLLSIKLLQVCVRVTVAGEGANCFPPPLGWVRIL